MWISTKAQYGLRALIEIAAGGDNPVTLKSIAEKQDISQNYLEQIAAILRKHGFINSVRGAHGGYRLSKAPEEISALEIVRLMEGSLAPVSCLEDPASCLRVGVCATESLWKRVNFAINDVLRKTNLGDLLHEAKIIQNAKQLIVISDRPENYI